MLRHFLDIFVLLLAAFLGSMSRSFNGISFLELFIGHVTCIPEYFFPEC